MKADYVNPFITGAMTTFGQELKQQPQVGAITATLDRMVSAGISVLVGLVGDVRGVVIYDMSERTAKAIASSMAGVPMPLFDAMAQSAIAELGNVITGLASVALEAGGYRVAISPPSIILGEGTVLAVPGTTRLVVPLELSLGTVWVYLSLHDA